MYVHGGPPPSARAPAGPAIDQAHHGDGHRDESTVSITHGRHFAPTLSGASRSRCCHVAVYFERPPSRRSPRGMYKYDRGGRGAITYTYIRTYVAAFTSGAPGSGRGGARQRPRGIDRGGAARHCAPWRARHTGGFAPRAGINKLPYCLLPPRPPSSCIMPLF